VRGNLRDRVLAYYPFHSRRQMDIVKRDCEKTTKKAISDGTLVQQPCEKCGKRKSEAHHDDYSKPLDVHWLCRFHHRLRDAELRHGWRLALKAAELDALPVAVLKRLALKTKPPVTLTDAERRAIEARTQPSHLLTKGCAIDVIRHATLAVVDAMQAERVPMSLLARRMGVSRQMVDGNFAGGVRTLKTLAAMADALGYEASVVLRKREPMERAS
jgi:hypothetical protein